MKRGFPTKCTESLTVLRGPADLMYYSHTTSLNGVNGKGVLTALTFLRTLNPRYVYLSFIMISFQPTTTVSWDHSFSGLHQNLSFFGIIISFWNWKPISADILSLYTCPRSCWQTIHSSFHSVKTCQLCINIPHLCQPPPSSFPSKHSNGRVLIGQRSNGNSPSE